MTTSSASDPSMNAPICSAGCPSSTAHSASTCGGSFAFDFNAYITSGADPALVSGTDVFGQYWSRDPASPSGTSLSNAIQFTVGP